MVHELGEWLAESERFGDAAELLYSDVYVQRLRLERMRNGTFNDSAVVADHPETRFRTVRFPFRRSGGDVGLHRSLTRFPFVPADPAQLAADCYEAFNIQVEGLVPRFRTNAGQDFVIGVAGGADSHPPPQRPPQAPAGA